jgi:hypothetical protein
MQTKYQCNIRSLTLLVVCLGIWLGAPMEAGAAATPAASPIPNFSNVSDILAGRRLLFPEDDIVVGTNPSGQAVTNTLLQTSNDAISGQLSYQAAGGPSSFIVAAGRVFNLPRDVVVTVLQGGVELHDQATSFDQTFLNNFNGNPLSNVYAMSDLTGDGFADIAFIDNGTLNVFTAADVNDMTKGFFYGTPVSLPIGTGGQYALAAGDFDGAGVNEIALASVFGPAIEIDIYRPQVTTNSAGQVTALTLQNTGSTEVFASNALQIALTAGAYNAATNPQTGLLMDQLVLLYQNQVNNGSLQVVLQPISIAAAAAPPNVTLSLANPYTIAPTSSLVAFSLQSAYLNFFGNTQQLVMMLQPLGGLPNLQVMTLDSQLNISVASKFSGNALDTINGMALGNFDQPSASTSPIGLEIALSGFHLQLFCNNSQVTGLTQQVELLHVDPNTFALSQFSDIQIGNTCYSANPPPLTVGIATGDTQGRSVMLGAPTSYTVEHIQPHLILGAPPMHVDWVAPVAGPSGTPTPEVLNLSAVPHGFNSQYSVAEVNSKQSSNVSETSFNHSIKQTSSIGYQFGGAATGSLTVQVSESAGFMRDHFTKKQWGQYQSTNFDASTLTGFGDEIWYDDQQQSFYVYPVIGQLACPSNNVSCTDAEKQPLTMIFSGISSDSQSKGLGGEFEWYQPIHEPGNIFSYPWNYDQLVAQETQLAQRTPTLLSQSDTGFFTDNSSSQASTNWSQGNNQSVTSGNTNKASWGASASFTKKPSNVSGGVVSSGSLSYNGSVALSGINMTSTMIGASTGLGINEPSTFPNPLEYAYQVFPYIFGDEPPADAIDNTEMPNVTVSTSGILRAAYTANPLADGSGSWWASAYRKPDIALNHPGRWEVTATIVDTTGDNCVRISSTSTTADCVTFNPFPASSPTDANLWAAESLYMKGLLITSADVNGNLTGAGPQIPQATAGDKILLQARIYNDSFTDITSNQTIVTQFYAEPWDPSPAVNAATGPAFLIEQKTLAGLPGFASPNATTSSPNWTVVSTDKLDTSAYSDQYLLFWVLVYIEQPDPHTGQMELVSEQPEHGLTQLPSAPFSSVSDAESVLEPHSNNLGFYKYAFYIAAKGAGSGLPGNQAGLSVTGLSVSPATVRSGQAAIVTAEINAKNATEGASIAFYDGPPTRGGTIFDVDDIAHIRAGGAVTAQTTYHPSGCGLHPIYVTPLDVPFSIKTAARVKLHVAGSCKGGS